MTFTQYWRTIQDHLSTGQIMHAWSVRGRARSVFSILAKDPSKITVAPQNGKPRPVTRHDFEQVYEVWPAYRDRKKPRHELGFSQNSTYIVTILHWCESRVAK